MFKDTEIGQTHSENDGCGEPAHNKTNYMKQKVLKKIQEVVPSVMEVKEGCQVMAGLGKSMLHTIYAIDGGVISAYLNKPFPKELESNDFYDCEFSLPTAGVEILGTDPSLADVLQAIKKAKPSIPVFIKNNGGGFLGFVDNTKTNKVFDWNLTVPFSGQTPETIAFIGDLLGVE